MVADMLTSLMINIENVMLMILCDYNQRYLKY